MALQSPTATLIPLFSSSELTGCGYPGLLDWKNRSDMCPRWESNPRLPACKASTLSTRPGSPLKNDTEIVNPHFVVTSLSLTTLAEFANCVDLEEEAHNEPPYLNQHYWPSIVNELSILYSLGYTIFLKICRQKICLLFGS